MGVKLNESNGAGACIVQRFHDGVSHAVIAAGDQREVAGLQSPPHHLVRFLDGPVRIIVAERDVAVIGHLHR